MEILKDLHKIRRNNGAKVEQRKNPKSQFESYPKHG